jgi:AraC-like DNA-binding protein
VRSSRIDHPRRDHRLLEQTKRKPASIPIADGISPNHPSRTKRSNALGHPLGDAAVLATIISTFQEIRVSASLRTPDRWHPFHAVPHVARFELAHGTDMPRWAYNDHYYRRAAREQSAVLGQHAGFSDFFVPVFQGGDVKGMLVVGPLSLGRPTSADLIVRWRRLTGGQAQLADPDFSHYLSMTLDTLTLDEPQLAELRRLLAHFAALLGGERSSPRIVREVDAARANLNEARFAERMWEGGRTMVDERTTGIWRNAAQLNELALLGMKRPPEHVVVGLLLGRSGEGDSVDDILKRDAFQRACVDFARRTKGFVCTRIGDHGVALLVDHAGKGSLLRARLLELGNRMSALARRAGLKMHIGLSRREDGASLPIRYQSALAAAEQALARGSLIVQDIGGTTSQMSLAALRRQLREAADSPGQLSPRFDRYIEAVAMHCRYRLDASRAHLEVGFDQVLDALDATGSLDASGAAGLRARLEKDALNAETVRDLSAGYRAVIADLETAISRPTRGRQDRAVRRAAAFILSHLGDPLTLGQVAKVAGFAPRYFSRLFADAEGMRFRRYVRKNRLARAKQLLLSTTLSVDRIANQCGFGARVHFHRAFKAAFRVTPTEYRKARPRDGSLPSERRLNRRASV